MPSPLVNNRRPREEGPVGAMGPALGSRPLLPPIRRTTILLDRARGVAGPMGHDLHAPGRTRCKDAVVDARTRNAASLQPSPPLTTTARDIVADERDFREVVTTRRLRVTTAILAALVHIDTDLPRHNGRLVEESKFGRYYYLTPSSSPPDISHENSAAFAEALRNIPDDGSVRLWTPRVGFFSTPVFFDWWGTNIDNQYRVTMSQTLIGALDLIFEAGDPTPPPSLVGLDAEHAPNKAPLATAANRNVSEFHGGVKGPGRIGVESFQSMLAQETATQLGTTIDKPINLGGPAVLFRGSPVRTQSPDDLLDIFSESGAWRGLEPAKFADYRDSALDRIYGKVKVSGSHAQKRFVNENARSREDARALSEALSTSLAPIGATSDSTEKQALAVAALFEHNVAPVTTIRLPFGGDNHQDGNLETEVTEQIAGIEGIRRLWEELSPRGLADRVTFAYLSVFGRTPGRRNSGGRNHYGDDHARVVFGPNVKPGLVGGLMDTGSNKRPLKAGPIDDIPSRRPSPRPPRPWPGRSASPMRSSKTESWEDAPSIDAPQPELSSSRERLRWRRLRTKFITLSISPSVISKVAESWRRVSVMSRSRARRRRRPAVARDVRKMAASSSRLSPSRKEKRSHWRSSRSRPRNASSKAALTWPP